MLLNNDVSRITSAFSVNRLDPDLLCRPGEDRDRSESDDMNDSDVRQWLGYRSAFRRRNIISRHANRMKRPSSPTMRRPARQCGRLPVNACDRHSTNIGKQPGKFLTGSCSIGKHWLKRRRHRAVDLFFGRTMRRALSFREYPLFYVANVLPGYCPKMAAAGF